MTCFTRTWLIPVFKLLLAVVLWPSVNNAAEFPEFSMGGFARLHVLAGGVSADRDLPGDLELRIPNIPVTSQPSSYRHRLNAHAQDSRLWVRALMDSPLGQIEALVEGDLAGNTDSHDPRLRHAYLVVDRLLIGQTWTAFTNTSALADIDAGDAVGNVVTRHRQVRWQQPLGADTTLTFAVEDSLNRLHFAGAGNIVSTGDRRPPDLVLRLDQTGDWGNVSLSMLAREITTTEAPFPNSSSDRQSGSAFSLAGRINTGALDNLRFMFNYGDALARYSTSGTFADATITPDGQVALSTTHSGLVAWQHFWTPRWRSTLAYSYSRTDPHRTTSPNLTRASQSGHTNLIWTPSQRYSVGIEYLYGRRELINGQDGELHRIQLTTRINF